MRLSEFIFSDLKDRWKKKRFDAKHYKKTTISDALIAKVQTECSEYLTAVKNTKRIWYRGATYKGQVFQGTTPNSRKPMDTDADVQEYIDKLFSEMGFKALRSNSIFCSADYTATERYGDAMYFIVPKNGFAFTWSPGVRDLYTKISEIAGPWGDRMDPKLVAKDLVRSTKYTNTNLEAALSSQNEVMVHGQYYGFAYHQNKELWSALTGIKLDQ
jgi:hypothetical protein